MTFTSMRFSDVQRLRILEMDDDSVYGALLRSKTKRPHGLPWSRACPLTGVTGSNKWVLPICDFHRAHAETNGPIPSFAPPCLDRKWELEKDGPSAYASTRRELALLCTGMGDPDGGKYTLHSPGNFLPAAATQMNSPPRELNVIGRWSGGSRMNERYDRSVRADELLLRNTIIQNVISGWAMAGSFFFSPETVAVPDRIGKEPKAPARQTPDLDDTPSGLHLISNTQESTQAVGTPAEEVVLADPSPETIPKDPGV